MNEIHDVAENLRKSRELLGLEKAEVADKAGITENRLTRIENATVDITLVELISLCKVLRVTPASMLIKTTRSIRSKVTKKSIEEFITIKEAAKILGISENTLVALCRNKEIPHTKTKSAYLFRWTEIDDWLDMQFNKRLKGKERRRAIKSEIHGIEPLIGTNEIKEIFGSLVPINQNQSRFIPAYYIGNRKKYRLSDVLSYLSEARVDQYGVPRFSKGWSTKDFNRIPSIEELSSSKLTRKLSYTTSKSIVPGYEWADNSYTCKTIEDAESLIKEFKGSLEHKWQLGEVDVSWSKDSFKVNLEYMRVPADWAGHKVVRTTRRADYPNQVKIKTQEFLAQSVPQENIIEVSYYTDTFFGIRPPKHCATISYYAPIENKLASDPATIINRKAKKAYEKLIEEATIKVPRMIFKAIKDYKAGEIKSSKLVYMLREANLMDRLESAGLIVYGDKREIKDIKTVTSWPERENRSSYYSWGYRSDKNYARLVKMSPAEDAAFEDNWERKKQENAEYLRQAAAVYNEKRRAAILRVEQNYQARLQTFAGNDKTEIVRNALSDEDWNRLVWLQKYWDQVFIEDGRLRDILTTYEPWEEFAIPIFDADKLARGWSVVRYQIRDIYKRLVLAGAILCQVYSGVVEINPCLGALLKEATGEDKAPRSWQRIFAKNGAKYDTCLRPNAELLTELVNKYSNLTLGKVFGVSDNAVKKWMKNLRVTRKGRVINMNLTEQDIMRIRKEVAERIEPK